MVTHICQKVYSLHNIDHTYALGEWKVDIVTTVYIKHAGERDVFHIIGLLSTTDFKYYAKGGIVLK